MKILIVDDTPTDRKILERIVTEAGHTVIQAADGESGIAMAKKERPDVIFMDIVMPDKDGFKATREIRKAQETAKIPVIMVSTKSRDSDMDWAKDNGATGYIVKPASRDQVLQALLQVAA